MTRRAFGSPPYAIAEEDERMLPFVHNLLPIRANPIGVDFGTETLRLAQVERIGGEFRLIAAATAPVPAAARDDNSVRFSFLKQTVRDLLTQGHFHGRRSILSLPASRMVIQHLRLAPDDASRRGALHVALHDRLRTNVTDVLLRHLVAGQVEENGREFDEIIAMAAQRSFVDEFLHAAALAKLDVIAMNVEPNALVDCFSHVYRRRIDSQLTSCYIDIGGAATRVVAARGSHILFARFLSIAGDSLNDAVARELQTTRDAARVLRIKKQMSAAAGSPETRGRMTPAADSAPARIDRGQLTSEICPALEPDPKQMELHRKIDEACNPPVEALIAALRECQHDHEGTFPNSRIDRLIFIGGESRDRLLCQRIALALGLPGQVGDPLVRMGRISDIAVESGIDRRTPQPAWAVAIGLSMGPAAEAGEMTVNQVS